MLLAFAALADEGMWLPEQIPSRGLTERGLVLDPAALADPKGEPLGAVVSLGHCTASFVSPDGLLATNGHCVQSYLEYATDGDRDLIRDGILVGERSAELHAGPAARIRLTESIEDVTAKIPGKLKKDATDAERQDAIDRSRKELVAACEKRPDRRCEVVPFFDGREWRLVTWLEIKDVRIVYAPPEAVYAFGGDEDNWMWPRHCGDFALLRAYVGPDGSPAPNARSNVPYKPDHWLKIQPKGVKPGEFVTMAGYPAATARYRTANEARHAVQVRYPEGISLLGDMLRVGREFARKDATSAQRLQNAIFNWSNSRKNYEGMLDNFVRSRIIERKQGLETHLDGWIASDPERAARYAGPVAELRAQIDRGQAHWRRDRLVTVLLQTAKLLGVSHSAYRLIVEREKPEVARDIGFQGRDLPDIKDRFLQVEKNLHLESERELVRIVLRRTQELPADQRIPPIDAWVKEVGGTDAMVGELYASTALLSSSKRLNLLGASRKELEGSTDPWMRLAVVLETWQAGVRAEKKAWDGALSRLRPAYMDALLEFRPGDVYPDANGTLRVSYGRVEGYSPREAVAFAPQTTLAGMARKSGAAPFDTPERVMARVAEASTTRWVDPGLGDVPVNFVTTLDNTNGSSGSPTLNARGELVGMVFDRNWEAVAADWVFDSSMTRSIHVDIRYMLWMLDRVERAKGLLQEMGVEAG